MCHQIANKIVTPDGTILQSFSNHDYQAHKDLNGRTYAIDGGLSCCRVIGHIEDLEIIHITTDDDFEVIRQEMYWGTYGKNGDEPHQWVYLNEMSNTHIKNILKTQKQIPLWKAELFQKELEYRKENGIKIKD
jgi:hypothetical protein